MVLLGSSTAQIGQQDGLVNCYLLANLLTLDSVWASLVGRSVRGRENGGSNPPTLTTSHRLATRILGSQPRDRGLSPRGKTILLTGRATRALHSARAR